jgi:hypothetical protein
MARRRDPGKPFIDIVGNDASFTIPRRKWRELLFVGALVREGEHYTRDPERPLPRFRVPDLFPLGALFQVIEDGERVHLQRIDRTK